MLHAQQLRDEGVLPEEGEDPPPVELDEDTRRLAELFRAEEERRKGGPGRQA
jgi:hypothetical protein